jgi:uncharacterized protein (DUF2141 family)
VFRRLIVPLSLPLSLLLMAADYPIPPKEQRGKKDAACRASEPGPAVRVSVVGLKDRRGTLRLELYPANDEDFLADDKDLIRKGKVFRRVDSTLTGAIGSVEMCVRAPAPGNYTMAVLHDRDGNRKFGVFTDGAGFPNNPKMGRSKPKASAATIRLGTGVSRITVRMNYWRGLSFSPLPAKG